MKMSGKVKQRFLYVQGVSFIGNWLFNVRYPVLLYCGE